MATSAIKGLQPIRYTCKPMDDYTIHSPREVPFCLLNTQSPREIKTITTNAENDATSGTAMFFFLQFIVQRPRLSSSTLKKSKVAYILIIISLVKQC